jgi:hypothetical protein
MMSDFKHKEMEGSLFENNYKERDSHPDYTGKIVFNDTNYSIAAWKNTTKSGGEYLKLKVSETEPKRHNTENKTYQSVGERIPSKHMKEYEKAKKDINQIEKIFNDEDIPF